MRAPYQVISADSHLEISANRWRDRVPEKYRDNAPKTIRLPDGSDAWQTEDGRIHLVNGASTLCAGKPFEEWRQEGAQYDTAAGAGSPEQRLREQDEDGVDAEVFYPSVNGSGVLHGIRNDDAYHVVLRAYNTWVAEEYCGVAPDRLIGLGVIPQRGVKEAIAEMEHCAKLGFKGVWIGKFPNGKMRPSPQDDEFWSAALSLDMPVTAHENFIDHGPKERAASPDGPSGPRRVVDGKEATGHPADLAQRICGYGVRSAEVACRLVIDGVFERFPTLQIYMAENQLGWIPNWLEQMDIIWGRQHFVLERVQGLKRLERPPSDYVRSNTLWGFMDNPLGVRMRHEIGVDRVMWGSDFPHQPTDWPHSYETIQRNMVGVPADEQHQMLVGNVTRFFHMGDTFESTEERERQVAARRTASAVPASV
ncbi:MAG TPA: amidohydrolase family protein [Chloroflexota bacterium]